MKPKPKIDVLPILSMTAFVLLMLAWLVVFWQLSA